MSTRGRLAWLLASVALAVAACSTSQRAQPAPSEIRVVSTRVWIGADWFPAPAPVLSDPTPAWSAPIRFDRHGDAARAGQFVVLGSRADSSDEAGEVVVRRVDPTTGADLWVRTFSGPGAVNIGLLPVQRTAIFSLVDDGRVVQHVLDLASGETLWFEDGERGRLNARFIGDVVVFDSTDGTAFVSSRSTGLDLWQTAPDVRLLIGGGYLFFLDMPGQQVGVRDPQTGEPIWSARVDGRPASPIFANGLVVVSAAPNSGDDELAAFDAATGVERWRLRAPGFGNGLKVPFREVLVVSDLAQPVSTVYGISLATGELLWKRESARQAASLMAIEIDGRGFIFLPEERGDDAADEIIDVSTGQTLASAGRFSVQSAISAGALYQSPGSEGGSIVALGLTDLEPLWTLPRTGRSWVFGAAGDAVLVVDEQEDGAVLTAYVEGDAGPE